MLYVCAGPWPCGCGGVCGKSEKLEVADGGGESFRWKERTENTDAVAEKRKSS